ncbi:MBL fold metallo-hydrolase [Salisediminibacterium selenitireducens]|uniref:Beta-lactamase domain protein n=1 Tax=Bacillus selenitireducens (strain ATCC 700615 / DSM 15326 / MLS10) TaxID=439292 RepID=D6Y135_BACIE|nr:MBL fold metallo-hydrolase [Salisediminibacterium selenitireducens]ADH98639.1 beta-lactamase domain protein [[Bacillus] selenitireducens MLS10]
MNVTSCGGVMEYGRSCFIFDLAGRTLMVDCGISKSAETILERYPDFSKRDPAEVDAVFVTHAHEDHTLGLPFAVRLGLHAPVYASETTIRHTLTYFALWRHAAEQTGMTVPYEQSHEDRVDFVSLPSGKGDWQEMLPGVEVLWGLNGHAPGSCWYAFRDPVSLETVFFSGDYTMSSVLMPFEWPPALSPDLAVMDAAYGVCNTSQKECVNDVLDVVDATIARGKPVVFHAPLSGKGQDWLYLLNAFANEQGCRFETDPALLEETVALFASGEVRSTVLAETDRAAVEQCPVIGTGGSSREIMLISDEWLLKGAAFMDPGALVMTTGPVTPSLKKYVNDHRAELMKLPYHVHPVLDESRALMTHLQPLDTLFSHADPKTTASLEEVLIEQSASKKDR